MKGTNNQTPPARLLYEQVQNQVTECLADGISMNAQSLGKLASAGQGIAGPQLSAADQHDDLRRELLVDGNVTLLADLNVHCWHRRSPENSIPRGTIVTVQKLSRHEFLVLPLPSMLRIQ